MNSWSQMVPRVHGRGFTSGAQRPDHELGSPVPRGVRRGGTPLPLVIISVNPPSADEGDIHFVGAEGGRASADSNLDPKSNAVRI